MPLENGRVERRARLYESTAMSRLARGRARPTEIAVLREHIQRASRTASTPRTTTSVPRHLKARKGRGLFKKGGDPEPSWTRHHALVCVHEVRGALERGRVRPARWTNTGSGAARRGLVQASRSRSSRGRSGRAWIGAVPAPQYAALRRCWRAIARWPRMEGERLATGLAMKVGRPGPTSPSCARTVATGDLSEAAAPTASASSPPRRGPDLRRRHQDALERFERRHGLVGWASGPEVLPPSTFRWRMDPAELNLERWRWLPETLGERTCW